MIEIKDDALVVAFPEVHPEAKLRIDFQRTLRIPDDGKDYPLPPGLGRFPMKHVDDHAGAVPKDWLEHGGVMLPMHQSEALWLNFNSKPIPATRTSYPFAIKVATGKINAVSGGSWTDSLHRNPQDYMVSPKQPWLDGYCVEKGAIRQFVAMTIGSGYSAEEQITGKAEWGGLQIVVYPMKREIFEKRFPIVQERFHTVQEGDAGTFSLKHSRIAEPQMGFAPGGRMRQEIIKDPFDLHDWEIDEKSRCFVHIANSLVWKAITGEAPPTVPYTAKEYTQLGLPWFKSYSDDSSALKGSSKLSKLKSVFAMGKRKGDVPLPENESVQVENIIKLRKGLKEGQVREGSF
jgi:hypothetical protein